MKYLLTGFLLILLGLGLIHQPVQPVHGAPLEAASTASFMIGSGSTDVIPHQLIRTSDDRLYFFGTGGDLSSQLIARWTSTSGLPAQGSAFDGSQQLTESSYILSVDAAYDGAQMVHVIGLLNNGQVKDYPFNLATHTFQTAQVIDTSGGTVSGYYVGTSGISAMFDRSGKLNMVYWTAANHILYRAYTYNASTKALTLVSGPTQLDLSGSANHPALAVSPSDGSLTVAWVSQASSPAQILTRTQPAGGIWGAVEQASSAPVWTSTSSGINIDQGPNLVIDGNGVRYLTYIENWRVTAPYDYGRVHFATRAGTSWSDVYIGSYSHDPAIAMDTAGNIYVVGHGYSLNSVCTSNLDMCLYPRTANGTWGAPQVFLAHQGSQNFDSSPSVKWAVVGDNRPETIEFLFADVGAGYANPMLYYGRINAATASNPTATATLVTTSSPTPVPPTATQAGTATLLPTATATRINTPVPATATITSAPPTATSTSVPPTAAATAGGAITYVQSQLAYSPAFVTSQPVSLPGAVTAGHTLVVAVSAYANPNTAGVASVSDSAGNQYIKVTQDPESVTNSHSLSIWVATNVKASSSLTITAYAAANSSAYLTLAAHEYTRGTVDVSAHASGTGTTASSGNTPNTTQAQELVFGSFLHEADSATSPTGSTMAAGFALRQALYDGNYEPLVTQDRNVSQSGAYSAALTWNKSVTWHAVVVTLK